MKHISTKRLLFTYLLLICCMLSAFAGSYDKKIVNRPNEGMFGNTYFLAYIISNIPKDEVMPPMCREAMLRMHDEKPHCNYVALSSLGTHGKRNKEFLPFDTTKRNQTIVVIDRSKLTEDEKMKLGSLLGSVFPLAPTSPARVSVNVWAQNSGDYGKENQVLVDLPDVSWLKEAANDLWKMPDGKMEDKSKDTYSLIMPVNRLTLLTNQTQVKSNLERIFRYTTIKEYSLEDFDQFRDDKDSVTHKVIAIDWNGEAEFSATEASQVLPPTLKSYCNQLTPDRMGISEWQRFCRKAIAQRDRVDGVEMWTICAPTKKYFDVLMNKVMTNNFKGGPFSIDLCDLTYMKTIAIGTIVDNPDIDRRRLVLQQRLEEVAAPIINIKVNNMVATQNWGDILDKALGKNSENDDPFRRPEDVVNVNQAARADGVLLLWVKTLQPEVTYNFPRTRLTPPFPAFNMVEPKAPSEPSPNSRGFIIFGSYDYPGATEADRRASDKFQKAYYRWKNEDMPRYDRDHNDWISKKRQWENDRDNYTVNYEYQVQTNPSVTLTGFLRVLDMAGNQNIIWSGEIALKKQGGSQVIKRIPVTIRGESADPPQPYEITNYKDGHDWPECTRLAGGDTVYAVGQDVLIGGMREGIMKLADSALWVNDLKPWNRTKVAAVRK